MDCATSTTKTTQTDQANFGDSSIVIAQWPKNGMGADVVDNPTGPNFLNKDDGGFLSNLFAMVLPKRNQSGSQETSSDVRTFATQTEEQDPIAARGQQLSYVVIQDLALENRVNLNVKDEVLDTLCFCVLEILEKHSILFNGMVRRIEVTQYHMFASVANELFEANANNEMVQLQITWERIVCLFAFAVRLVQEYRENPERVDSITLFLALYITKHIIPFVKENGEWNGLVDHFPLPEDSDAQLRRAVVWSGLCVGLIATMCVSSLLH